MNSTGDQMKKNADASRMLFEKKAFFCFCVWFGGPSLLCYYWTLFRWFTYSGLFFPWMDSMLGVFFCNVVCMFDLKMVCRWPCQALGLKHFSIRFAHTYLSLVLERACLDAATCP